MPHVVIQDQILLVLWAAVAPRQCSLFLDSPLAKLIAAEVDEAVVMLPAVLSPCAATFIRVSHFGAALCWSSL